MDRQLFREQFRTPGIVVLPVIHVQDEVQTQRNVDIAIEEGAHGVVLVNHDFPKETLIPMLVTLRAEKPSVWMGVNFLGVPGKAAFPILGNLAREGVVLDAYMADDACIDERRADDDQPEADATNTKRAESGWNGLYFGGTAFKKQRPVAAEGLAASARIARRYMDVVMTSGAATGVSADVSKIETFRAAVDDAPLALASGVTVENAAVYAPFVDAFLVATGINHVGDFYNIDPARLRQLVSVCSTARV